jgi:hypothetical protein
MNDLNRFIIHNSFFHISHFQIPSVSAMKLYIANEFRLESHQLSTEEELPFN